MKIYVISTVLALAAHGQSLLVGTPGDPRPTFDVASVKWIDKSKMERNHEGHLLTAERFVDRTELIQFISMAYVRGDYCTLKVAFGNDCPLIAGDVPGWAKNERFEILANIPPNTAPAYSDRQVRAGNTDAVDLMLQVLLEDRFGLRVHREKKELPVYVLTVDRDGAKLAKSAPGFGPGAIRRTAGADGVARKVVTMPASSMDDLANFLGENLDRLVVNQTSLEGDFDLTLEYEEEAPPAPVARPAAAMRNALGQMSLLGNVSQAELDAALKRLGLRLQSGKAPVEILVIDSVQRPSEN